MPGSVSAPVIATPPPVLPASLCSAFKRSEDYPARENIYLNGESQRASLATSPRRRWALTKRLIASEFVALRDFWIARRGPVEAFYYYDPYYTSPLFSHDPTGAATTGRYTVCFDGRWSADLTIARSDLQISLIEIG